MQTNLTCWGSFRQRHHNARFLAVRLILFAVLAIIFGLAVDARLTVAAQGDGSGEVAISGELKQRHKVTLTLDGPWAREADDDPSPFTDYRLTVTFRHESGSPQYAVPGYFCGRR